MSFLLDLLGTDRSKNTKCILYGKFLKKVWDGEPIILFVLIVTYFIASLTLKKKQLKIFFKYKSFLVVRRIRTVAQSA